MFNLGGSPADSPALSSDRDALHIGPEVGLGLLRFDAEPGREPLRANLATNAVALDDTIRSAALERGFATIRRLLAPPGRRSRSRTAAAGRAKRRVGGWLSPITSEGTRGISSSSRTSERRRWCGESVAEARVHPLVLLAYQARHRARLPAAAAARAPPLDWRERARLRAKKSFHGPERSPPPVSHRARRRRAHETTTTARAMERRLIGRRGAASAPPRCAAVVAVTNAAAGASRGASSTLPSPFRHPDAALAERTRSRRVRRLCAARRAAPRRPPARLRWLDPDPDPDAHRRRRASRPKVPRPPRAALAHRLAAPAPAGAPAWGSRRRFVVGLATRSPHGRRTCSTRGWRRPRAFGPPPARARLRILRRPPASSARRPLRIFVSRPPLPLRRRGATVQPRAVGAAVSLGAIALVETLASLDVEGEEIRTRRPARPRRRRHRTPRAPNPPPAKFPRLRRGAHVLRRFFRKCHVVVHVLLRPEMFLRRLDLDSDTRRPDPSSPPDLVFAVPYRLLKCVRRRFRALMLLANSPAMTLVECPLNTASSTLYAANVDSCTSTSAPAASRDTPTESHVSPSRHRRRPGRSHPNTCSGWIHDPSFNCTDSPFFKRRLYAGPGGPERGGFLTSMRPDWSGSSTTYPKHGTGCVAAGRANDDTALGASARPARVLRRFAVYGPERELNSAVARGVPRVDVLEARARRAPLSGHRSPKAYRLSAVGGDVHLSIEPARVGVRAGADARDAVSGRGELGDHERESQDGSANTRRWRL